MLQLLTLLGSTPTPTAPGAGLPGFGLQTAFGALLQPALAGPEQAGALPATPTAPSAATISDIEGLLARLDAPGSAIANLVRTDDRSGLPELVELAAFGWPTSPDAPLPNGTGAMLQGNVAHQAATTPPTDEAPTPASVTPAPLTVPPVAAAATTPLDATRLAGERGATTPPLPAATSVPAAPVPSSPERAMASQGAATATAPTLPPNPALASTSPPEDAAVRTAPAPSSQGDVPSGAKAGDAAGLVAAMKMTATTAPTRSKLATPSAKSSGGREPAAVAPPLGADKNFGSEPAPVQPTAAPKAAAPAALGTAGTQPAETLLAASSPAAPAPAAPLLQPTGPVQPQPPTPMPPSGTPPALPVTSTLDDVAVHVARAAHNRQPTTIHVQLQPASLGRLEITLNFEGDDAVRVVVRAERAETVEQLARHGHQLERALQQSGLDIGRDGIRFDLDARGQDGSSQQRRWAGFERESTHRPENAADMPDHAGPTRDPHRLLDLDA
ncbi:MAG: flagellar hook-length control protein FliK [Geminicoccaceae bacterium]|nr:MAG: flagellar hook-length control protein FliK [Geminicoccaceae bacterium]